MRELRSQRSQAKIECRCAKGHASEIDGLCRFCREKLLSRAEAKRAGVKTRGDGITLEAYHHACSQK
jgi:hypothetical protein